MQFLDKTCPDRYPYIHIMRLSIAQSHIPSSPFAGSILVLALIATAGLCLVGRPAQAETILAMADLAPQTVEGTDPRAAEDDGVDANLVPVDTEFPSSERTASGESSSSGPIAEDLLNLNPFQRSTSLRFGDMLSTNGEAPQTSELGQEEAGSSTLYNVPIVLDPSVQSHIRYFNTSIRNRFEQWLFRLSRYRPLVENIFAEFNLPSDLVYLSLVESGFNPYAYSRAKATGPWQFMKGTAKVYGLRVDSYVDERRDPIKSTVAAARYLRDLYDMFGTWPLAMAAYNAGEGKVMRALHKAQAESFTDISKTKLIRRETKEYVPRFMAATIIAKNPDRYGFSQEPGEPHQFEEVVVNKPLHFRSITNVTGIPYEELRLLNPELRRDATPPGGEDYHLKVPVGSKSKLEQLLDRIPSYKFPPLPAKQQYAASTNTSRWYKVRVGDTLEKVSKRFRVPLKTLKTNNSLTSPVIRPGDFLVITR